MDDSDKTIARWICGIFITAIVSIVGCVGYCNYLTALTERNYHASGFIRIPITTTTTSQSYEWVKPMAQGAAK
jgi:hypothetical protein